MDQAATAERRGCKLHWLQWPVKYRLLTTSHSNTGCGFQWLLMHFEHIWCYDAVFSTLTRAMEVPGPRTVCPGQPAQASCAAICRASVLSSLPQQATLHIFATARMQSGNLVAQSSGQGSGVQDQERVKTNWTNWAWAKIKCPNAASNSKLLQTEDLATGNYVRRCARANVTSVGLLSIPLIPTKILFPPFPPLHVDGLLKPHLPIHRITAL